MLNTLVKKGFKIKVIVYIRPVAELHASSWSQILRNVRLKPNTRPRTTALSEHVTNLDLKCNSIFASIEKIGQENVIVRPYEKCQWKNNNLIEDFMSILDFELKEEFTQVNSKKNFSVGRNSSELLRCINYLHLNDHSLFYQKIQSLQVSDIKVLETLTDAEMLAITEQNRHVLSKLAKIYDKESFFINEFPSCYGKERPIYDTVSFSAEQYAILIEALEVNQREKNAMEVQLDLLQDTTGKQGLDTSFLYSNTLFSTLKFVYILYRIASELTFGKTRKKYKEKKLQVRALLSLLKKS